MAEDLIVSRRSQWSEQLSCRWMADESWCYARPRGTWQLCHVRRLAFPLNISFYLMQHTPLWRSKFRILRIKKTRTKIGTPRISHTSLKLHRDIPSGSFTESDLRKIAGAITDKVWWLSRAYKCSPRRGFMGFAFVCICILLSFYHSICTWSCDHNSVFSSIQQARYIDVSISEFQKHAFENFQLSWCFLIFLFTILWRCKLKSPQNGNLKSV